MTLLDERLRNLPTDARDELLRRLAARTGARPRPESARAEGPRPEVAAGLPLSFAQERMWFLSQVNPDDPSYNIPAVIRFAEAVDVDVLRRSLDAVVARHEILRTAIRADGGSAHQIVGPAPRSPLPVVDLRGMPPTEQEARADRFGRDEALRPFDPARGPMWRATVLLRDGGASDELRITFHHLIADGWSLGVFARDLAAFYRPDPTCAAPGPLSRQYGDYARWDRSPERAGDRQRHVGYWVSKLSGAPTALRLPQSRRRPERPSHRGAIERFTVSPELAKGVGELSRNQGATLFMTLLAAFDVVLARVSGQRDIVVGTPVANRSHLDTESLIGFFANTVAMRTDLEGDPPFSEVVRRVKETALGALDHAGVPFEKVVERVVGQRDPRRNPLFQVAFALQDAPMDAPAGSGLSLDLMELDSGLVRFDLECHVWTGSQGLHGGLLYRTDLFDAETVADMARLYENVLAAVVAHPALALSEFAGEAPVESAEDGGEVERALNALPGVRAAAVRWRHAPAVGREPVAYVVADETFTAADARSRLEDVLPAARVPARYARVTRLPERAERIDEDALFEVEVLDADVVAEWERRFRALPGVDDVVVLVEPVPSEPPSTQGSEPDASSLSRDDLKVRFERGDFGRGRGRGPGGDVAGLGAERLVAYVSPRGVAGSRALVPVDDRYGTPTRCVVEEVDRLPRTATGALYLSGVAVNRDGEDGGAPRTETERRVAAIWEDLLGVPVGRNDTFLELGGHSLLATQLLARLRRELAVELSLPTLLEGPTVAAVAAAVDEAGTPMAASAPDLDAGRGQVGATLVRDPESRYLPFPLTDVQQAYWVGRTDAFELGAVAPHEYMEFDSEGLDVNRLERAWQRVIDRHDMLRAIVLEDGRQQVQHHLPPFRIETADLRGRALGEVEAHLGAVRQEMSHEVFPTDRWPLFRVRASLLDRGRVRLHVGIDAIIFDAHSWQLVVQEVAEAYENPACGPRSLDVTFRDYVLASEALEESEQYRRAQQYWYDRLDDLPPAPDLPLAATAPITTPVFTRRSSRMPAAAWSSLKERAARAGVTPSVAVLTAYAETLALFSRSPRFTVNLTLFNRLPFHPDVERIVGDFTSLTLLAVDCRARAGFGERARALQAQLASDLEHRQFSGLRVLREKARGQSRATATMPVVFSSALPLAGGGGPAERRLGTQVFGISQTPQVWLDAQATEQDGDLVFEWDSVEALFPAGFLDDAFATCVALLEALGRGEEAWSQWARESVPGRLLIPTEPPPAASSGLLHDRFFHWAATAPEATAVVSSGQTLTYADVANHATRLARDLRERGAGRNQLVAVYMEKGWEQVVAVIGIVASGAAYLPVDATLPDERARVLLEEGNVGIVVTQPWLAGRAARLKPVDVVPVDALPVDVVPVDALPVDALPVDDCACQPVHRSPLRVGPERQAAPGDLAYVIFTSGSTGRPKGVMIDHQGALNTIDEINQRFDVGPGDRVLALSSLSFDLSVYDIFGILAAGGTVVVPDPAAGPDPARWVSLADDAGVTIWNSVPALMQLTSEYLALRKHSLPSLRLVLLSGDWIPVALPDAVRRHAPSARVVSLGGATEASIWSILYPIDEVDPAWTSIPYGRAMRGQSVQVLDANCEPRPTWVPDELFIGGLGVAQGYWGKPELTGERFVTHPRTGQRLYRTGDIGRLLPGGDIEFLGREDGQVKVQGYRIELGEIESALRAHPTVAEAVVVARGEARGEKRLAAYVVPSGPGAPAGDELRRFLAAKLPSYQVPADVVVLERLPLTANGKVDRRALPEPAPASAEPVPTGGAAVPSGAVQDARVADIVAAVLGIDDVDAEADLIQLGATSIDVVRIINGIEQIFGVRPAIDEIYLAPTVAALAEAVAAAVVPLCHGAVVDPEEREAFKQRRLGLRAVDGPAVSLGHRALDEEPFWVRRSHRAFAATPLPLARFGQLLGCLSAVRHDGGLKYRYGSAGGLYPVQTYLQVNAGRIASLEGGTYYYDPVGHRLRLLTAAVELDARRYDRFVNRPMAEQAAFAVYLVAEMAAISPLYGEDSLRFATIEAGAMAQLLEQDAGAVEIGLCQIGGVDFDPVRDLLGLADSHRLVHSLLGGPIPGAATGFEEGLL
jgi:amino acid adenylation domain-containing protein